MIDLVSLPWLIESPEELALIQDRTRLQGADLRDLVRCARTKLDEGATRRLAKAARLRWSEAADAALTPVRLCLACQATADFLPHELIVAGLRFGLAVDIVEAGFNQLADLAFGSFFEDDSRRGIDINFVGLDYRQLSFREDLVGDEHGAQQEIAEKMSFIRSLCEGIHAKTGAPCIVQNLIPQPQDWIGSLDRNIAGSMRWLVDATNAQIRTFVADGVHYLFDAEHLASEIGLLNWHDPGMWYLAKLGFAPGAVPYFTNRLAAVLAAAKGKSRRVLVLDLDNTLWGGVIGDDGVEGIKIGQGSAIGEAFLDVHMMARLLKRRGIILAVSSKNDESVAKQAFEQHSSVMLGLEDFAVFRANWEDKASNIRHIAQILNLGLDSLVVVDDNPAEREIVRQNLPDVAVPEIGENPAEFARIVMAAGYFEAVTFSVEDRQRAQMYRDNVERASAMEFVTDMDAYLASLHMRLKLRPFDQAGRSRIAQLINKSNQFNLTTRRYTEAEIEELEQDNGVFTLQANLADRFGDNGMISVVICRSETPREWTIDTWLMSCRVLKRRVEDQVLQYVVGKARTTGIVRLKGIYRPTPKNGLVKNHYRDLGFAQEPDSTPHEEIWWLDVSSATTSETSLPFELL
jgi:FkbH-like protein